MKKHLTLLLLLPFCVPATNRCVSEHLKWIAGVVGVSAVGCMVYKWWTKKPKELDPKPAYASPAHPSKAPVQDPQTYAPTPTESVEPSAASPIDLLDLWENPAQGLDADPEALGFKAGVCSFLKTIPSLEVRADNSHIKDQALRDQLGSVKYGIESYVYKAERLGFPIQVCLRELRDTLHIIHEALQAINGQEYNLAGGYQMLIDICGEEAQDRIIESQMQYAQGIINHLKKKLA